MIFHDASNLLDAARWTRAGNLRCARLYDSPYGVAHLVKRVGSRQPAPTRGIAVIHSARNFGVEEIVDTLIRLAETVDVFENRLFSWNYREDWTEIL